MEFSCLAIARRVSAGVDVYTMSNKLYKDKAGLWKLLAGILYWLAFQAPYSFIKEFRSNKFNF
jgi:hypothetical protein